MLGVLNGSILSLMLGFTNDVYRPKPAWVTLYILIKFIELFCDKHGTAIFSTST